MSEPASPAPDHFASLLNLVKPDILLRDPRATGAGVKVCVIDSGMDRSVLEERCRQRGESLPFLDGGVFIKGQREPLPYEGRQSSPHGTTVADIILTLAPQVSLYSADIIGPQGSTEVDVLLAAMHWAINVWQCHVLNLSLGIPENRLQPIQRRYQLLRLVEEAYFRDILVFAAAHNEHPLTLSYPALFAPPLVSVDKGPFTDPLRFAYTLREQIEFRAYSRAYVGPLANEPATSWATPHLAAIAARLLSLRPGLKPFEIKTLLYWMGLQQQAP